jgi:nucleoside-diphosphate kinase
MMERTFIAVKHDGVLRGLVGEAIKRFEQKGLKIAGMKMIQADREKAEDHYKITPEWVKKLGDNTRKAYEKQGVKLDETNEEIATRVQGWLMDYLTEGPIVAIVFEGYHAIEIGRKIVGHAEARQAPPGTIRGDYTVESYQMADTLKRPLRNIMHASGNKEEAENEIAVWFRDDEMFDYKLPQWKIMH